MAAGSAGTLLMLAPPTVGEWAYYPGFFLLGFGGPGIQISTFHLANLYPTASGSLIAASTALFDAGTAVFFAFSLATASGDMQEAKVSLDLERIPCEIRGQVLSDHDRLESIGAQHADGS